jgi:hypothetical protein
MGKVVVRTSKGGLGVFVMNIAVAAYLFATGIIGLAEKSLKTLICPNEIRNAVVSLFGTGNLTNALVVVLAVLAIVAGVFILLKLFGLVFPMSNLILVILAIAWLVFMIMIDIIQPLRNKSPDFVNWLRIFGSHLMVLAGMILAMDRFRKK